MADTPTSLMVILTVVDFEPAELLAQMVKTAPASTTLGVPEMVPLLLSKLRPEGRVPLISHEVTLPDVLVLENDGDTGLIALPLVAVMFAYLETRDVVNVHCRGTHRHVNVVLAMASVGVPEMVPFRQFMERPSGSIGEMS